MVATNTLDVYGEEMRTLLTKCLYNASRETCYEKSCRLLCCAGSRGTEGEAWEAKLACTSEYEIADEYWDWGRDSKGKADGADGKDSKASP